MYSAMKSLTIWIGVYKQISNYNRPWKPSWGSTCLYSFFNVGARLGWVVNTKPWPLNSGERELLQIYRKLGGKQGRLDCNWKISPPPGFDPRPSTRCKPLYRHVKPTRYTDTLYRHVIPTRYTDTLYRHVIPTRYAGHPIEWVNLIHVPKSYIYLHHDFLK
jgi:hypothetical protein